MVNIPPTKMVFWMGDGLWHCYTNIRIIQIGWNIMFRWNTNIRIIQIGSNSTISYTSIWHLETLEISWNPIVQAVKGKTIGSWYSKLSVSPNPASHTRKAPEKPCLWDDTFRIDWCLIWGVSKDLGYRKISLFSADPQHSPFFGGPFSSRFHRVPPSQPGELEMRMGMMERNVLRHQVGRFSPSVWVGIGLRSSKVFML